MILVTTSPQRIIIKGHAEYGEYGRDIVCSSVSSIVTTSINAILIFGKKTIDYKENEGLVEIDIIESDCNTKKLLNNMLNLLEELSRNYPENIKVEREER